MIEAFDAWITIDNDILNITAAVPPAFNVVVESVDRPDWRLLNDVLGLRAGDAYDAAKRQLDNANETLYFLCLLASWAAFESLVEDGSAALIRTDRALIDLPGFDKARTRADREGLAVSPRW